MHSIGQDIKSRPSYVRGDWKCETGIIGTNLQGWKMRDQAVMESQTSTCYGTLQHDLSNFLGRNGSSRWAYVLLFFFFFCGTLRRYISEMAGAIALKLSHMIGSVGT